jgi:outer membrane PBP1 activator LpoA protein
MTAGKALFRSLAPVALSLVALLLAGCPSTTSRTSTSAAARAEEAMRSGDHAGAAALYEKLAAEAAGSDIAEFRLRAARAWLAAGRPADADRVLAALGPGVTQQQALEQRMLGIQSALAQGNGDQAWREISSMPVPAAPEGAARYYETRQQVAIATGHLVDGIRAELARERLVPPGEARRVRSELLGQLRAAAERGVALTPPPGSDATIRGWLEAASVALDNARNPTLGATRLNAFRNRYPSHPALSALAGEPGVGIEEAPASLEAAPHLALVLPLTGRAAVPPRRSAKDS